jgi:copper chaperone
LTPKEDMEHTFNVQGMTCGHCELAVKKAVMRLDPHAQVDVDRSHNKVVIQSEQPKASLAHAIESEGYSVA